MKTAALIYNAGLILVLTAAASAIADSLPVEKAVGAPKLYMHYMPWFQSPTSLGGTSGGWGWHWTMNNQNPNNVDASGKRQIAAHYYPKIGPYDSTDPSVLEYHLLLMKYSGIDGTMVDWYGTQGSNGDVGSLLTASNAFINKSSSFGVKFSVVLEDRFARNVGDEQAAFTYLKNNYIYLPTPSNPPHTPNPNYLTAGPTNSPLITIFGPITFNSPSQWNQIFPSLEADPEFLTLPGQSSDAGSNSDGEYAWPYQDPNTTNHITKLRNFYSGSAPFLKTVGGVAYPGFNDFYAQGNAGSTLFYIPENNGQTLTDTLNLYRDWSTGARAGNLDFLQLATFNDFGEGTMFEPTVETGFKYLTQLQSYYEVKNPTTHAALTESDLQMIYELYLARKKYASNSTIQAMLAQVSSLLSDWQTDAARALLNQASPDGDYNGDGAVTMSDFTAWRSSFGKSTIIYGSGADGDYNGSINLGDYVVWRKSFAAGGGTSLAASIPEPSSTTLLILATVAVAFSAKNRSNRAA